MSLAQVLDGTTKTLMLSENLHALYWCYEPTSTANGYQPARAGSNDAFVSKLSADGKSLVFSTYLGGSSNDQGNAVAVGLDGTAYLAYTDWRSSGDIVVEPLLCNQSKCTTTSTSSSTTTTTRRMTCFLQWVPAPCGRRR